MADKYFVYSGYRSPDNYNSERPTHTLTTFSSPAEVAKFRKEFDESGHEEHSQLFFSVFFGRELVMKPKEVVTDWEIS